MPVTSEGTLLPLLPSRMQCVKQEADELHGRINELSAFVRDPERFDRIDVAERRDLLDQLRVMREYLGLLDRRLRRCLAEFADLAGTPTHHPV